MTTVSITIDLDKFNEWKNKIERDVQRISKIRRYYEINEEKSRNYYSILKETVKFLRQFSEETPEALIFITYLEYLEKYTEMALKITELVKEEWEKNFPKGERICTSDRRPQKITLPPPIFDGDWG